MNNKIEVSYIIGHKDRTDLLRPNFDSLLTQSNKNFEIIITDNSGQEHKDILKNLVSEYRQFGLNIKLFFVDPKLCKTSHDGTQFLNRYNPALQQNVAVKKSQGRIVVLTSPEVINSSTNVENIIKSFNTEEKRFVLGWIDEIKLENINEVKLHKYDNNFMKAYSESFPHLNGASCKPGTFKPWNYFLGCLLREDYVKIGGMDEDFMAGIAYEDNEFSNRCINNGMRVILNEDIVGLHLFHGRGYQAMGFNVNPILMNSKIHSKIANNGKDWGSNAYITGEY